MNNNISKLISVSMDGHLGLRDFLGKLNKEIVKSVWIIKGKLKKVPPDETCERTPEKAVEFFCGVCVGSEGFILTSAKIVDSIYDFDKLRARKDESTTFKRIQHVLTDEDSGLAMFKVKDNTTNYDYVAVSNLEVGRGSELVGIGVQGDQAFRRFECYVPVPAATIGVLVENPLKLRRTLLPCRDTDPTRTVYLPIYGLEFASEHCDYGNTRVCSSTTGSPVFDKSGSIVAVISMGVGDFCFASPVTTQIINKFDEVIKGRANA